MRILLVLLVLSSTYSVASAAPLIGSIDLVETNIPTFDPVSFTGGPNIDVYHVSMCNPNVGDVTVLDLSFPGVYENRSPSALTFKAGTDLPMIGPHTIAETFFVLPEGFSANDVVALDTEDSSSLLKSGYLLHGPFSLIGGGQSTSVIAVLSVPTGTTPDINSFVGRGAVNGRFEFYLPYRPDHFPECPEPSTVLLAAFGVASFTVDRRS